MTAPKVRKVDQHTGEVAPPWLSIAREMTKQRDKAIQERDDARSEFDNLIASAGDTGRSLVRLWDFLKHAVADRDAERDRADAAESRVEELEGQLKELITGSKEGQS